MQKLFIIIHYCLVFYFELTKVRLYRGITKYIFRNLGIYSYIRQEYDSWAGAKTVFELYRIDTLKPPF